MKAKIIKLLIKKKYLFNFLLDPIQYDGRVRRIIYYFHRNNEPLFYLALVAMIIGTQLFLAGFIGELISRSSGDRNKYQIEKRV